MIFRDANDLARVRQAASKIERERMRNYEGSTRENLADMVQAGKELLDLFQLLPSALLQSERMEYERLANLYGKNHPQTARVAETLEELEQLEQRAQFGRPRARRAMETMQEDSPSFSGFVSDAQSQPLEGYTVRLAISGRTELLQTRTAEDGFFRVPFPQSPKNAPSSLTATVEIRDRRGDVAYQDPVEISIDNQSVYREYQIDAVGPASPATARPGPSRKK